MHCFWRVFKHFLFNRPCEHKFQMSARLINWCTTPPDACWQVAQHKLNAGGAFFSTFVYNKYWRNWNLRAKLSKADQNQTAGEVISVILLWFLTPLPPCLPPQVHVGAVGASRCAPVHRIPLPAGEPSLVDPARPDPEGPPRAQPDPRKPEHRRGVRQHQEQHRRGGQRRR